jgi:two-component system, sensor histidine kinase PdtaS
VGIERNGESLTLRVVDDGVGLADGFDLASSSGLGLSIVRALVTSDLQGAISVSRGDGGEAGRPGTEVMLRVPVIEPDGDV